MAGLELDLTLDLDMNLTMDITVIQHRALTPLVHLVAHGLVWGMCLRLHLCPALTTRIALVAHLRYPARSHFRWPARPSAVVVDTRLRHLAVTVTPWLLPEPPHLMRHLRPPEWAQARYHTLARLYRADHRYVALRVHRARLARPSLAYLVLRVEPARL